MIRKTDADRLRELEAELNEEMEAAIEGAADPAAARLRYLAERMLWLLSGPDGRENARLTNAVFEAMGVPYRIRWDGREP